jgi:hypothetical protein
MAPQPLLTRPPLRRDMERRVFQARYDYHALDGAYHDAQGISKDIGKVLVPPRVREGVIHQATILMTAGELPPLEFIRNARRIHQTEYTPADTTDPHAGIHKILGPYQIQTTFRPETEQYRIDVVVRPLLTDTQIRRSIGRHHYELAEHLGTNAYGRLPRELLTLTRNLQKIARLEDQSPRPPHRRDIYDLWEYQPPTGPYDWNARATGLLPASPRPLPDLALSVIHYAVSHYPIRLRIEYTPRSHDE